MSISKMCITYSSINFEDIIYMHNSSIVIWIYIALYFDIYKLYNYWCIFNTYTILAFYLHPQRHCDIMGIYVFFVMYIHLYWIVAVFVAIHFNFTRALTLNRLRVYTYIIIDFSSFVHVLHTHVFINTYIYYF